MCAMSPRLLRPTVTGFSPKSIAGLAAWIDFSDAASVTLDGSNKISAVSDKSGNGYHGTQTTSGNRLGVAALNGRQCADGGTAAHSLAVLYTHLAGSNLNFQDGYFAGAWDAGGSTFPAFCNIVSAPAITGTAGGALALGASGTANLFGGCSWHSGSFSGTYSAFNNVSALNGAALAAFPQITSPFVYRGYSVASIGVNGWCLGTDRQIAGRGWLGRIGELVMFSRVLSESESLAVRRYLSKKWGAPTQT